MVKADRRERGGTEGMKAGAGCWKDIGNTCIMTVTARRRGSTPQHD